jgi:hypothetical protein
MKKTQLVTLLIAVVFVISIVLLFAHSTPGTPINKSPESTMWVHVIGCPNCNEIYYCIDGVYMGVAGGCDFKIECTPGKHTICVKCALSLDAGGSSTFECNSVSDQIIIDVNNSRSCDCYPPKKK